MNILVWVILVFVLIVEAASRAGRRAGREGHAGRAGRAAHPTIEELRQQQLQKLQRLQPRRAREDARSGAGGSTDGGGAGPALRWERPGGRQWRPLDGGQPEWRDVGRRRPPIPATTVDRGWFGMQDTAGTAAGAGEEPEAAQAGGRDVDSYRGSLGFESEEGATMHDVGTVLGSLSMMFDDETEGEAGAEHAAGPIPAALSLLRSPGGPGEGAGIGIVLAEILGPPRAVRRAGPGGARARWR